MCGWLDKRQQEDNRANSSLGILHSVIWHAVSPECCIAFIELRSLSVILFYQWLAWHDIEWISLPWHECVHILIMYMCVIVLFIVCNCSLLVALVWFCHWLLLHECSCTSMCWWKLLIYHKVVISSLTCRTRRKWMCLFTGNKTWRYKRLDTRKTMWKVREGCGTGYLTLCVWKRKRSKIKSGVVPELQV